MSDETPEVSDLAREQAHFLATVQSGLAALPGTVVRFTAVIGGFQPFPGDADADAAAFLTQRMMRQAETITDPAMLARLRANLESGTLFPHEKNLAERVREVFSTKARQIPQQHAAWILEAVLLPTPQPPALVVPPVPSLVFRAYTPPVREASDEAALVQAFTAHLVQEGHRVALQVPCAVGIADVVTEQAVYEVKYWLTRQNFVSALGQVQLYRAAINPRLRAVIVGFEVPSVSLAALIHYAQQLDVEVLVCNSRS